MVEFLFVYVFFFIFIEMIKNVGDIEKLGNLMQFNLQWSILFWFDISGLVGLIFLYVVVSMEDGEDIVDVFMNDFFQVGIYCFFLMDMCRIVYV